MNTQEAGEKVRQGRSVSTEQDSVRRLAEIRARLDAKAKFSSRPDRQFYAHSHSDITYLLSLIDSLTAERDNAAWRADRLDEAGRVQMARAEAAEAEVKRLREALETVNNNIADREYDLAWDHSLAALATPPSEGG